MLELLKNNFHITNRYIILIIPMIFIIIAVGAYLNGINYFELMTKQQYLIANIALWILLSGCSAGWFYVVRKTLQYKDRLFIYENDRHQALKGVLKSFFKGIGRLFLPFLVVVSIFFITCMAKNAIYQHIIPLLNEHFTFKTFQLILFMFISCISYWIMFWIPEIVYTERNPLKALFNSTKKAFITFPRTIYLFLTIWFMVIGLYILFALSILSITFSFFILLLSYYIIFYTIILIYTYYEQNFLE